jgi:hypothetical protein
VFESIDTGEDNRVGFNEFKLAVPELQRWGVDMS